MSNIAWNRFIGQAGNLDVLTQVGGDYIRFNALTRRVYCWLNRPVLNTTDATIVCRVGNQVLSELVPGSQKAGTLLYHPRMKLVPARSDIPTFSDCVGRQRWFNLNNSQNWSYLQFWALRPPAFAPKTQFAIGPIVPWPQFPMSALLGCGDGP